jgi:repressor LexA
MPRQRLQEKEDVLRVIQGWIVRTGTPPTIEELRRALKVGSTRTVFRYLRQLEDDRLIERWQGARGMKPLRGAAGKGLETIPVPLVGEVAAGPLMLAEQNVEGWIRIPRSAARPSSSRFFLLRVRGHSMNRASVAGERIEDGDLVLVRQHSAPDIGAIAVVLIDGEATIKRLAKGTRYWILKPESTDASYQPTIVESDFTVQGVVVRVFKRGTKLLGLAAVDQLA